LDAPLLAQFAISKFEHFVSDHCSQIPCPSEYIIVLLLFISDFFLPWVYVYLLVPDPISTKKTGYSNYPITNEKQKGAGTA
jgi:hypothetical protein